MGVQLLQEVRHLLAGLETTQRELSSLFAAKRKALTAPRPDELLAIADSEARLTGELQELLKRRAGILEEARRAGLKAESISAVVHAGSRQERNQLEPRIQRARLRSEELRRESWVHWVVAHRTHKHYTELLEMIAHYGRKAPTYGGKNGDDQNTPGGALLDASA